MPEPHHDFYDGNNLVPAHRHMNPDGSLGGWVAKTAHVGGKVYIAATARVSGNAHITDYTRLHGNAWVFGAACITDYAQITDSGQVFGYAHLRGNARVCDNARVSGYARVSGGARIRGGAKVLGNSRISGQANICGQAKISGHVRIFGTAQVGGSAELAGNAWAFADDILQVGPFGTQKITATITLHPVPQVHFGSFIGTLSLFKKNIQQVFGQSQRAKEYVAMTALMEAWAEMRTKNSYCQCTPRSMCAAQSICSNHFFERCPDLQ